MPLCLNIQTPTSNSSGALCLKSSRLLNTYLNTYPNTYLISYLEYPSLYLYYQSPQSQSPSLLR